MSSYMGAAPPHDTTSSQNDTVPALLRARVGERADSVLLVCDDDVLTYADADRRSAALARGLLAAGVGKGTRVGILHPNGSAFAVAWLAAARVGAISVPLSTFSTASELATLLRNADVAVLLAAARYRNHDYVAVLREAVPDLDLAVGPPAFAASAPALRRVAFTLDDVPDGVDPAWTTTDLVRQGAVVDDALLRAAEDAVTPADRMVIVHTSGSTSEPKGVIHTHGALLRHLDNLNRIRRYTPDEVLFSNSPFFWIGGFAYVLVGTLLAGAKVVCSNATDPAAVLDLLERERPTMVNGYAQSVAHLADDPSFPSRDLSSIRRGNLWPIMPASARPDDPALRHNMLGMTETGSVCLVDEDEGDQPEHRRGSFGRPAPGFEARVVAEDGMLCGPGEVGELHLRGAGLMEGYDGRERHETFTPDGWFPTGDLFSTDEDGFFYFKGRAGDMIKTAGANVSPREVEAAIHDVTGLAAHVVGVDDEARGQLVAAAMRVPDGQAVDVDDLLARLRDRLSSYKVPRRIVLVTDHDVPTMSSGKLDIPALKALLRGPAD